MACYETSFHVCYSLLCIYRVHHGVPTSLKGQGHDIDLERQRLELAAREDAIRQREDQVRAKEEQLKVQEPKLEELQQRIQTLEAKGDNADGPMGPSPSPHVCSWLDAHS